VSQGKNRRRCSLWAILFAVLASGALASDAAARSTLTVTDNEGCASAQIGSGSTLSCSGSPLASTAKAIRVAYPGVGVHCPRSAAPRGCRFTLQGVTRRRGGKLETLVSRVKVRAGKTAIAALHPKPGFIEKLGTARVVLVRQTLRRSAGSTRTTVRRLPIRLAGTG
jgi:hypothetical protein